MGYALSFSHSLACVEVEEDSTF